MPVFGVICEYDPFHLGHRWMLEQLHRQGPVVCAMSGCFTQRGEFAAVNKFARAEMAVRNGADLVLELPTPWAVSGAERFARGGVELLKKTGVVTHLAFGSECGDLEALQRVEACLSGESFQETLRRRLEGGETFARCRQAAVEELLDPRDAALLSQPNNILAIEYLKALRRTDFSIEPITFPRRGGPHDGGAADGIASASHIRRLLRAGHTEEAMAFLPRESAEVLRREIAAGRGPVDMHTCQRAILARLRTMSQEDFLPYDGGGEGLYRRFYRAVRQAADIDGLLEAARTRRYPLARLRRMLLAAYLELPEPEHIPYLRLLAASSRGCTLLRRMRGAPVLTKPADVSRLGRPAQDLFTREAGWTDLYTLAYPDLSQSACGADWRATPWIM